MQDKEKIMKEISGFQESFFAGKFSVLGERFANLADDLSVFCACLTSEEQSGLIELLNPILTAYAAQDYLLVADLLEYTLRPFIETGGNLQ